MGSPTVRAVAAAMGRAATVAAMPASPGAAQAIGAIVEVSTNAAGDYVEHNMALGFSYALIICSALALYVSPANNTYTNNTIVHTNLTNCGIVRGSQYFLKVDLDNLDAKHTVLKQFVHGRPRVVDIFPMTKHGIVRNRTTDEEMFGKVIVSIMQKEMMIIETDLVNRASMKAGAALQDAIGTELPKAITAYYDQLMLTFNVSDPMVKGLIISALASQEVNSVLTSLVTSVAQDTCKCCKCDENDSEKNENDSEKNENKGQQDQDTQNGNDNNSLWNSISNALGSWTSTIASIAHKISDLTWTIINCIVPVLGFVLSIWNFIKPIENLRWSTSLFKSFVRLFFIPSVVVLACLFVLALFMGGFIGATIYIVCFSLAFAIIDVLRETRTPAAEADACASLRAAVPPPAVPLPAVSRPAVSRPAVPPSDVLLRIRENEAHMRRRCQEVEEKLNRIFSAQAPDP